MHFLAPSLLRGLLAAVLEIGAEMPPAFMSAAIVVPVATGLGVEPDAVCDGDVGAEAWLDAADSLQARAHDQSTRGLPKCQSNACFLCQLLEKKIPRARANTTPDASSWVGTVYEEGTGRYPQLPKRLPAPMEFP